MQTFTIKVSEAPRHDDVVRATAEGRKAPAPRELPDIRVQGRHIDAARREAKKRLHGAKIRSMSCGLAGQIHVVLEHPDDVTRARGR